MRHLISSKRYKEALDLYHQQATFTSHIVTNLALKACTNLKDYQVGIEIHQRLPSTLLEDPFIQTSLIHLYMQSRHVAKAEKIFFRIKKKTVEMYGAMFKGYLVNHSPGKVFDLFEQMPLKPHEVIIITLFNACTKLPDDRAIKLGTGVLQTLPRAYFENEKLTAAALDMLMKFGHVSHAERIFDSIEKKNVFTYGSMLKGYIQNNLLPKAFELFEKLPINPNEFLYSILFHGCASSPTQQAIDFGKKVLGQMPRHYLADTALMNSTLHMLMIFGEIDHAECLFRLFDKKDIVSYSTMMKGYAENKMAQKALDLFEMMPNELKPNAIMYSILFSACASLSNQKTIDLVKKLLKEMPKIHYNDIPLMNSAIHMLMTFGDTTYAENLFSSMKNKNVISYGIMMKGYAMNNLLEKGLELFENMPAHLEPNSIMYSILCNMCGSLSNEKAILIGRTILSQINEKHYDDIILMNSVLDMLMKFGYVDDAQRLFSEIKSPSDSTIAVMITGYSNNDLPHESLKFLPLIENYQSDTNGIDPWILPCLHACAQIGFVSVCRKVVKYIPQQHYQNPYLANALISMWGKVGAVDEAVKIFETVNERNPIIETSMISAYGRNGMGYEAVDVYQRISRNSRDEVSHISVLNACSHAGLVDEARSIFASVESKTEKIVTVMVDCLSRLCLFDEALQLISHYEQSNPPSTVMYMAVLSGTRNHHRIDLSQQLYDRMRSIFSENKIELTSASVLLSNTYSYVGDYQQAEIIRNNRIEQFGNKIKAGISWTEVNGEIVKFKAHDRSHPKSDEIYGELERLSNELLAHGHEYDSSWIIRPLKQGESVESVLCGHSEKLAIAFNFIEQPRPNNIQVTKNLRVCGDCHRATKLIAKIRQCEIIVRDANRIHHFYKNGQCSCQDHF